MLAGKVCVVTGASKGMGRAFATALVAAGAKVGLLARESTELRDAAATLGGNALAVACDISDPGDVQAAFDQAAEQFGRIDVLVNNAAAMAIAKVEDVGDATIARQFAINLAGPVYCCRAAIPHLRAAGGGDVVFVSSESVTDAFPFLSLYAASKAGLEAFANGLRAELRDQGTRVTVFRSGRVEGSSLRAGIPAEVQAAFFEALEKNGHLAAIGQPVSRETMAAALVSLLALPRDVNVDLIVPRGR